MVDEPLNPPDHDHDEHAPLRNDGDDDDERAPLRDDGDDDDEHALHFIIMMVMTMVTLSRID